jgi:hypothetical protein
MAVTLGQVAQQMAIPASTTLYTQAVSMQGANAVQVSFVILTLGGSSGLTPTVEGSNDLENWSNAAVCSAIASAGYQIPVISSGAFTAIAWQYVRLKLAAGSGGTIITSAIISTAAL